MNSTSSYPPPLYRWTVVALLLLTAILAYTDRQVLSLLVDPVRRDLGIGDTEISLLLGTAFALVYGIAGIPLGWLADRWSRRNMIVGGIVLWSLATVACGLAHSYAELFAARIFVGLGEAVLSPAAISLISDYFPPQRRGTAVGFFLAGIAIGAGGSIVIGGLALSAVESGFFGTDLPAWRLVLLLIGAPGLLWGLLLFAIREPERRTEELAESGGPRQMAGWQRLAPLYAAVALASLVDNAVGAWSPSLLIRQFSLEPAAVGVTLGLLLVVGFGVGVLAGGMLADWAGSARGKIRVCLAAALLILPDSALLLSDRLFLVEAGVPLYFLLSGIVTASGFSAILDYVPNRSRGLAMSVSFFLNVALGAACGPTAVALASAHLFGGALAPAIAGVMAAGYLLVNAALGSAWRKRTATT